MWSSGGGGGGGHPECIFFRERCLPQCHQRAFLLLLSRKALGVWEGVLETVITKCVCVGGGGLAQPCTRGGVFVFRAPTTIGIPRAPGWRLRLGEWQQDA